ncbi:MAG: LysM domain-containing protein [Planctomycetaceae bacterium]
MHRDVKLGLALAVLLIGSTTAFFFRDDADLDAGLPQLQNPERLDGEVARRGVVPYLGQPEAFELSASELTAAGEEPTWAKPAFLGGASAATFRRTSVTPDPIQIILEEDAELMESLAAPAIAPMLMKPSIEENGERQYVVQPGDTLTGLAARFLGSLSRYHEIYELNRDRIAGPDDLRVGMMLRIPPADSVRPAALAPKSIGAAAIEPVGDSTSIVKTDESLAASNKSAAPDSSGTPPDESNAADAAVSGKLFVPAKKPPFVPRQYRNPVPGSVQGAPTDL